MIGTSAARAWSMASWVCGMTPSSAATTSTTTSVTLAPRARISVNASCPGVSRKTMRRSLIETEYAPMCCVMPPASPPATFVSRIASRSVVLPWSTWPMTVTTGTRATRSSGLATSDSTMTISSSNERIFTSAPNSRAMFVAVSELRVVLMVIINRFSISFFRTSFARTSSLSARSLTVMPSASVIVRVIGGGGGGAVATRDCARVRRYAARRPPGRWCGRGGGR